MRSFSTASLLRSKWRAPSSCSISPQALSRRRRTAPSAPLWSCCHAALRALDLKPVGRLDKQTEGLLLFTDDGDLLHRLISPKKAVEKRYYARHAGQATGEDVRAFQEGLTLRDGTVCLPAVLEPLGPGQSLITVCEGKYHQVRRMMASRGMTVTYLQRRQEGALTLGDLPLGAVRELGAEEIERLEGKLHKEIADLTK